MPERSDAPQASATLSARQQEVLTAALHLMVEEGDGFTMNGVAARANCSKETLYKWFGDREGLLTATVQWQAAKVKISPLDTERPSREETFNTLQAFAESWLTVLTGDISIALNRLAVSHAGSSKSALGKIVLENGPFAMARRLHPILSAAEKAGVLNFADREEAFRTFFGLVVRDVQIRGLLGEARDMSRADIQTQSGQAVEKFFKLYGVKANPRKPDGNTLKDQT